MQRVQVPPTPALPSARSVPRPTLARLAEKQWALTGLALALLVLLLLPSAQIKLAASQLNGLIGSYTSGGHLWQVSYSSTGTTTWHTIGPDGTAQQGSRQWPATGSGDGFQDSTRLDGTTSGTVTATLTWVPSTGQDNTTDPPSSSVIVTESGSARWGGGGLGTGNADDGWGDPVQYAVSSGVHYEVKDGSSGSITITKSLSASTPPNTTPNAQGYFDRIGAFVAASLSVSGDSNTITLGGTAPDSNGKLNILVGQGCTASLNTPPFSVQQQSGWTWTVSGTTFQDWQPTTPYNPITNAPANSQASYYSDGSGPLTNPTAHWYWNDPGPNPTPETVTCTATVTPNDGKNAPYTVTVTQKVSVQVPGWSADGTGGYMQVNASAYNANGTTCLWAGPGPGQSGGMNWTANSFTPQTPAAFGTGTVELVQLVTPNMSYVNATGVGVPGKTHYDPEHGQTGLDTAYPYPGPAYTEGSIMLPYRSNDSPTMPLNNAMASAMMQHQFTDHLLYLPPGADVRWVPLASFTWSTNGSATNPGGWSNYVAAYGSDSAGTVNPTAKTLFTAEHKHPSWTQISRARMKVCLGLDHLDGIPSASPAVHPDTERTLLMKKQTLYVALALCLSVTPAALGQIAPAQHLTGVENQDVPDLFSGWTSMLPAQHLPQPLTANYKPPTPEEQAKAEQAAELAAAAVLALHAGRYAEAVAQARQALSVEPGDSVPEEVLAAALDAQGKEQEAYQEYHKMVVDEKAQYTRVLLPYALLLLKSGQWGQAVTVYNQAIAQFSEKDLLRANSHFSPDVPEPAALAVAIHIAKGVTYNAGNDWAGESHKEMMAEFSKALQLAPDADLANYYYGFGWRNLDPKERTKIGSVQQAKAALQKAVLLGKGDVKKAAQKVLKDLNKPA